MYKRQLYGYATGEIEQLKWKIDSLKADLGFYREQYTRYFQKYMETQMGLLLLISNQTAFLPLWNISMQITLSNIRYDQPPFSLNRTIQVRIDYYGMNKTYGYCGIEAHNFTWINLWIPVFASIEGAIRLLLNSKKKMNFQLISYFFFFVSCTEMLGCSPGIDDGC